MRETVDSFFRKRGVGGGGSFETQVNLVNLLWVARSPNIMNIDCRENAYWGVLKPIKSLLKKY